jgi:hypothetical protein
MKTRIGLFLCLLAAAAGPAALPAAEPAPAAGKVLLLDNERVLEGDIERADDQYRVRRASGETLVPAGKALYLGATLDDAYAFLRRRANLNDPDERLRLARWCHLYGLRAQALAEVTAAVDLRPDHPEACRLLASLRQSAGAAPAAAPTSPAAAPESDGPPPDLTAESLCAFRTRVQPILMNACANCHAGGHSGAFKLTRVYEDGGANRKVMQRNVAAVLAQLNLRQPQGSPLLTKAVSAHDGKMAQAPLKGRQAPAYRVLEGWVEETLAGNPQLQAVAAGPAAPESPPAPAPEPKAVVEPAPARAAAVSPPREEETGQFAADAPAPAAPAQPPASARAETAPAPAAPAGPVDPFDPVIFNRQMHPGK